MNLMIPIGLLILVNNEFWHFHLLVADDTTVITAYWCACVFPGTTILTLHL
jgi:hypothetical protein|tara:strand:- start:13276 stop:13428 length:153 start_codon:yes stop_codon:yes gene_type:complete